MKTKDFDYPLPEHLIAYQPLDQRSASRLLCLDSETGDRAHKTFADIADLLNENDVLVFNNSKVISARLTGKRDSGGKADILIERVLEPYVALAHLKTGNPARQGSLIFLSDGTPFTVQGRQGSFFVLELSDKTRSWHEIMEAIGHVPLPPYIEREDELADKTRYQTVYADDNKAASAAAPTAGLHFDQPLLETLKQKGVKQAFVTLHVGAGTFQPLRTEDDEDPRDHPMHSEAIDVPQDVCDLIMETKENGGRIIAVGTTSVRSLESAWSRKTNRLEPYFGETKIFIAPGYQFGCIDALVTNFHFPRTTLLMLVSALTGRDNMMDAYMDAIEKKYRFYSYGDAMYIAKGAAQ